MAFSEPQRLPARRRGLVDLPYDVQLLIVHALDPSDAVSLAATHSSWLVPCRSIIFAQVQVRKRSNESLARLVRDVLPAVGPYKLSLSFEWMHELHSSPG